MPSRLGTWSRPSHTGGWQRGIPSLRIEYLVGYVFVGWVALDQIESFLVINWVSELLVVGLSECQSGVAEGSERVQKRDVQDGGLVTWKLLCKGGVWDWDSGPPRGPLHCCRRRRANWDECTSPPPGTRCRQWSPGNCCSFGTASRPGATASPFRSPLARARTLLSSRFPTQTGTPRWIQPICLSRTLRTRAANTCSHGLASLISCGLLSRGLTTLKLSFYTIFGRHFYSLLNKLVLVKPLSLQFKVLKNFNLVRFNITLIYLVIS